MVECFCGGFFFGGAGGAAGIRLPLMGQGEVGAWTLSVTRPVSAESRSTEGWGMMPLLLLTQ